MNRASTILGLLLGSIIILLSMVDYSTFQIISAFFNLQGILVVLGGTLAAVLINYPLNQLGCAYHGFRKTLVADQQDMLIIINKLAELSHMAHKQGLLSLEKVIPQIKDDFLRYAVTQLMVHHEETMLEQALEVQQLQTQQRHFNCQEMFQNMASYAPAFGMIGTVMGLIIMMTSQMSADPLAMESDDMLAGLLTGMGLALVTTFYGVLLANLIFVPIAGKLKTLSEQEMVTQALIHEAIMAIKRSHSPILVREMMMSYLTKQRQQKLASAKNMKRV
ncbi:flagellar motor protein MotA [Thiomicrospira aerophila AL3]|uniref:Flagellar motor protein MotA n=1 Tax=Thiomicrospira aerophila AL3 TaxID=717772 RepID=W0DV47_9GAMM|nr:MotA/TolQ/ExbB proton channel family protein [Thiomicrospira aerophila]AHF00869.1 flagellar motor protein MotA [Thiomicrospira aerophila AL3]